MFDVCAERWLVLLCVLVCSGCIGAWGVTEWLDSVCKCVKIVRKIVEEGGVKDMYRGGESNKSRK